MKNRIVLRSFWIVATFAAAACSGNSDTQAPADSGTGDSTSADSGGVADTGTTDDAAGDSGTDGTVASDAADDASTETGADTGTGGGTDAGSDAGTGGGTDGGADAGGGCVYASTILADKPLAYLRLDETSGTTAADNTGNGNTGTYTGSVTLGAAGAIASCPGDTAATLDGITGWIDLGNKFGFLGTLPFSLEIWINPSKIDVKRALISKFKAGSFGGFQKSQGFDVFAADGLSSINSYKALGFERWQSGAAGLVGIGPNGTDAGGSGAPVVGTWMHIVAVYDGSREMLYTNGALASGPVPSAQMIQAVTVSFAVGSPGSGVTGEFFAGTVDEVAVYDTALSAAQVQAHYQAAK